MRHILIKTIAAAALAIGMSSCADDLNIHSIDPQSSASYGDEMQLLAKQYSTLGLTGQKGPAGSADISGDEGESGFFRTICNLQELPTDECLWAWQDNTDIPQLTNIAWSSSSTRVNWAYQRLAFNITLYNSYLHEMGGRTDGEYVHYNAEVRFLRALCYYYYLDLFRKAPFKIVFDTTTKPVEKAGKDLYDWLDNELTEIEGLMADAGSFNNSANFGRADAGAAYALHARLALNSEVYTNGQVKDYEKAVHYCDLLINNPAYALSKTTNANGFTGYEQVFMGDNDYNTQAMKEIIFPIRQDGVKTRCYAGSTYLIASCRIAGMPYSETNNTWSCIFAREALVKKFFPTITNCPLTTQENVGDMPTGTEAEIIAADEVTGGSTDNIVRTAGDDRALFYGGCGGGYRSYKAEGSITGFTQGLSIVKWTNRRSDLTTPNDMNYDDTDIPLFRLAEAYLTRAEANYRLGKDSKTVLADLNELRSRAHATSLKSVDLQTLIDEWSREFYLEGRRRSDLVRFGMFSGNSYLWDWKGGVENGTSVDSHYDVYPLPADEVAGNSENLTQNDGY